MRGATNRERRDENRVIIDVMFVKCVIYCATCFSRVQGFILKEAPSLPVSSAPSSSVVVAVVSLFASRRRLRLALFWMFFSLVSSARLPRKASHSYNEYFEYFELEN